MVYIPTSLAEFLSWYLIDASPSMLTDIAAVCLSSAGFLISVARLLEP